MVEYIYKENNEIIKENTDFAFSKEYDVIVAGVGVAGIISVIMAGKRGLKVLGIEKFNTVGGTMTTGGVCGYYFGNEGGYFEELDREIEENHEGIFKPSFHNSDVRSYVLEKKINEAGADIFFSSVIVGLYIENKNIIGAKVLSEGKLINVKCKAIIDSTGDGEVSSNAGCKMYFGRSCDNSVMPFSSVKIYREGSEHRRTNFDCGKVDQRDIFAYSKAIISANAVHAQVSDGQLLKIAPLPGIREGNLIDGKERITAEGFLNGERVKNPVMYAYADLDKHGDDSAFDSEMFKRWRILCNMGAINITVPVSLNCLLPKEYDNLIVAGRSLSVDHEMLTCIRMNRDAQKMGEIAADAVYLAIKNNVSISDVPHDELLSLLKETGCFNEENNKGFRFDATRDEKYRRQINWLTDFDKINTALSTLSPSVAMWSCYLLKDKGASHLIKNLESDNENLRKHSAIALAAIGKNEGCGVLYQIIKERDVTQMEDMRKGNAKRLYMAICALGIIKDKNSIDLLIEIITNPNEFEKAAYFKGPKFNRTYYKTISHAASALMAIANEHKSEKERIINALDNAFSSLEYIKNITPRDEFSPEYLIAKGIYDNIEIWKKGEKK